jgi:hypothetical protein
MDKFNRIGADFIFFHFMLEAGRGLIIGGNQLVFGFVVINGKAPTVNLVPIKRLLDEIDVDDSLLREKQLLATLFVGFSEGVFVV